MSTILGLDIGGTKSAAILGDVHGNILNRREFPTGSPSDTLQQLLDAAQSMARGQQVQACGISCGGPLASREGLILSPPNLPGWDRVPVVEMVQSKLGTPARLENDANAAALAEWQWGLARSVHNLIYLTCGTGQGAGLILNGQLYRGTLDLAGEIGHVRLKEHGPVGYGKAGSVEGLTSGKALGTLASERAQNVPNSPTWAHGHVTGKTVGDAARAGDPIAQQVVAELARHLGHTCAILIDLLNPQRISLGTLALRLGPEFLDKVRAAAREEALPSAFDHCAIEPAALGDRVQDCAALAVGSLIVHKIQTAC